MSHVDNDKAYTAKNIGQRLQSSELQHDYSRGKGQRLKLHYDIPGMTRSKCLNHSFRVLGKSHIFFFIYNIRFLLI